MDKNTDNFQNCNDGVHSALKKDEEPDYSSFIENMDGFQSENAVRKELREKKQKKKDAQIKTGRKGLAAKRYRSAVSSDKNSL